MKINTKIIIFLFSVFLINSCTKKDFEGPSIENIYGEFEIIESFKILNKNPNFSINEKVSFHCEFNKPIEWKISIKGLNSSATKEIIGFSNIIDSNVIFWDGGPSQLPFFLEEICLVDLTFSNEIDSIRDTLNINVTPTFENGIWLENFEDGIPENSIVYYNNDGGGMTFSISDDNPLLGQNYFKMGGRVNWDWPLGNIDIPMNLNDVSLGSEELFINIGILSDLQDLHTGQFINILISEETITPFNDNIENNASDIFESTMEVYKMKIPVDWDGWQLKSFRYSDFEPINPNDQDINYQMNPSDIRAIRIACQACPSSSGNAICPENFGKDVRTDIDHIIFTSYTALLD